MELTSIRLLNLNMNTNPYLSKIESMGLNYCCRPLSVTPLPPCLRRLHRLIALIGFAGNLSL